MSLLPEAVQQAYTALKASEWNHAVERIEHALDQVQDPRLQARLHGWHAQALSELGELLPARAAVRRALLLARDLGSEEASALAPLKTLHGRITAMLAADDAARRRQAQALAQAALPLADLLAEAHSPAERAAVYLARADALVDADRHQEVPDLIASGLDEAPPEATREQVLLRLAHLRIRPPQAPQILAEALEIAEEASSETLLTACAHAARDLGLPLAWP